MEVVGELYDKRDWETPHCPHPQRFQFSQIIPESKQSFSLIKSFHTCDLISWRGGEVWSMKKGRAGVGGGVWGCIWDLSHVFRAPSLTCEVGSKQ